MFIDHRYEVLESLGSGTWANVYKVRDVRTGNLYTLKLFQYLSSEEFYKHFKAKDMHHITKIEHPNLNHVVDFGHVGDHIYFISDYFEGSTLNNFRFSKTKVAALYNIIVQICYALNALHNQNILHKDLKPENILYKASPNSIDIKLIDYGFSRLELDKDSQYVSGTLPYIAPEVYLGKQVGFPSDFYSLGVLIYRLTTGSFPFSLEQINALRSGSQQYFIPIFPSELNPNIPLHLEKLCLRLLERNPDNRFQSSAEIIDYINRSSGNEYPFSVSWSLVNSIQFNSYTVRENVAAELWDYLPQVEAGNGKIISLIGGEGLGKESILSLFRYHILRGSYFIFDYNCTRTEHEAFFALIKEYLQSLAPEEIEKDQSLYKISEKMRRYLFTSEQSAKGLTQSQEDLKADFEFAKSLLIELSKRKPVIFIVRNIQHVHRYTIDFINFFSEHVVNNRILVLLSTTDFNKVSQIEHTILLSIPMFEPQESRIYIRKLMNAEVPEYFCDLIHQRSSGNPYFIREILIDLTLRKLLVFDTQFHYPANLDDYTLPSRLVHSIYSRMSHLTDENYKHMQKLSIAQTPISRELIRYICKVKDNDLYKLLNEGKFNEILEKRGNHYHFTYPEAKERFFHECPAKLHNLVSLRVLKYYETRQVNDIMTCRGIIRNAQIAADRLSERKYMLHLAKLLQDDYDHEEAYTALAEVIRIDLSEGLDIKAEEKASALKKFQGLVEITGFYSKTGFLWEGQRGLPETHEKHLLLGTLKLLSGDRRNALKHFARAEKMASDSQDKLAVWLYQAQVHAEEEDPARMKQCLDRVAAAEIPQSLRIRHIDLLAAYNALQKDFDQAIQTLENFLAELPPSQDPDTMARLALLHNALGEYYSIQKNVSEANEHFSIALGIWNRYGIKRYLGLIHCNIADLNLKQGYTLAAEKHSRLAWQYATRNENPIIQGRALLYQGEAKIKLGEFEEAEEKLLQAADLAGSSPSKRYHDAIQRNLALAKSKIIGLGHYFQFISEHQPELMDGRIAEINPLVKTYFYYLSELSNPAKLKRLLRKNAHIDFTQIHEQEFYHNILSLLAIMEKDYETALKELKLALQFAGEINNQYAVAVFNVLQVICHYGSGDYARAAELINLARPGIQENHYRYWEQSLDILALKLDLANDQIPLRNILRRVNQQLESCQRFQYYQIEAELRQLKIQLLAELNALPLAEKEFSEYRSFLERITSDISEEDRQHYLQVNLYSQKDLKKLVFAPIASRKKDARKRWNDLIFDIANVNSVQRVKFLIEKGITQIISPWQFRLMAYSDKIAKYYNFLCFNCDPEQLLPPEFSPFIERAFEADGLVPFKHAGKNHVIVPLTSGNARIGFLVLNDNGEMEFTIGELAIIRNIKTHLTALIIRTWDYMDITLRMEKMNQLMNISHELMRTLDRDELEHEIVSAAIDFTEATRGFMIKRDSEGNNLFQVQMDQNKQLLSSAAGISKTALSLCQTSSEPVITFNAETDNLFKSSISVQDYAIQTICCCPILIGDSAAGYLYLDNYGDSTREMYLNKDVVTLLLNQISIAIKNSAQYANLIQKSSELNAFEQIKDEFMAIVSHELYTPLTTMQGYVSRLKRKLYADEEERLAILGKLENSVLKLTMSVNDITTMNHYNITKAVAKAPLVISEILDMVNQEVQILSRQRRMKLKVETEKDLPPVLANWEAMHRMIYNIVLNAVRFTREFGSIVIGARRSAFPQEKIANKESLVIYVKDNGMGIPQHRIKDIFRKFYELNEIYAHKSGTVEYRSSGLGLGLSISKRIAELHGGQIVIKSKENEGTSVFIIMPFK